MRGRQPRTVACLHKHPHLYTHTNMYTQKSSCEGVSENLIQEAWFKASLLSPLFWKLNYQFLWIFAAALWPLATAEEGEDTVPTTHVCFYPRVSRPWLLRIWQPFSLAGQPHPSHSPRPSGDSVPSICACTQQCCKEHSAVFDGSAVVICGSCNLE